MLKDKGATARMDPCHVRLEPGLAGALHLVKILKARYEMEARARHAAAVAKMRRRGGA